MKKLIPIILILIVLLTGCSKTEEDKNSTTQNSTPSNLTNSESGQSSKSNQNLPITFKDAKYKIVFDYPDYQTIEQSYSRVFNRAGNLFITYNRGDQGKAPSKLDEIIPLLKQEFLHATERYFNNTRPKDIVVSSTEIITYNNIETLKVKGSITVEKSSGQDKKNVYMVGYVFVKDDVPCQIIGVVTNDGQQQEYKDELNKNIDLMMASIRDKR